MQADTTDISFLICALFFNSIDFLLVATSTKFTKLHVAFESKTFFAANNQADFICLRWKMNFILYICLKINTLLIDHNKTFLPLENAKKTSENLIIPVLPLHYLFSLCALRAESTKEHKKLERRRCKSVLYIFFFPASTFVSFLISSKKQNSAAAAGRSNVQL